MRNKMNQTHIHESRFGLVPMGSAEGRDALLRHVAHEAEHDRKKRQKVQKEIDSRGMEALAQTKERLLLPLQELLKSIKSRKQTLQQQLKNPELALTLNVSMNPHGAERQIKDFVDRNEHTLASLNKQEQELLALQESVKQGMARIAQGARPAADFLQYLDGVESRAAARVFESGQKEYLGSFGDKEFKTSREELKAYADLRSYIGLL